MLTPIEEAELKQMREHTRQIIVKALKAIQTRIEGGQFDLAKDLNAQAEIIMQAIEDN